MTTQYGLQQSEGEDMKTTVWQRKKVTMFIGGDPAKNETPTITLELDNPQIQFDSDKNVIIIFESK
jgi:hypothetical protein